LELLQKQKIFLLEERNLEIRIVGLANSKKIILDAEGVNLENWKEQLNLQGQPHDIEELIQHKNDLNVRNLVVVDNTASEVVAMKYDSFLTEKMAIITCNKIACSSNVEYYSKLKKLVKVKQTPFLYETNVGAGLPIIDTVKNLITTGDKVHKMKAVLSGSLNFIFNTYNGTIPFSEVVKQAQIEGYTEPDPRLDLSGGDVIRKIIILIRESGHMMEQKEVLNKGFLDEQSNKVKSVDEFYESLSKQESFYKDLYEKAHQKGCKLKFVASYEKGKASVGLEEIPSDHPFYHLEGKDNIVLFFTDRYQDNPLLIKGAGAGASVTASGIFADVLRLSNI
jgi:aspartokinase/homoserine dehydrogenase 1